MVPAEHVAGNAEFATQVAQTTYGWNRFWVNDRLAPYRPTVWEPAASKITKLLLEVTQKNTLDSGQAGGVKQTLTIDIMDHIYFPRSP